jgi:hypothetical protein
MNNDPELNGKYLGTITKDFAVVATTLREAAAQLKYRKIDQYPIFPISKGELPIGELLIGSYEMGLGWNYYFSFLQEFIDRQLVAEDRIEAFKATYKDPSEFCCLFVVDGSFVNFMFIPYPDEE